MIETMICNLKVQLPVAVFGAILSQKEKIRLQCTSREWRNTLRTPAMWLGLSCRSFRGNAQQLLVNLKSARFAQVRAFALSGNKLTLSLCKQIQNRLPLVCAIDAEECSWKSDEAVDALVEGFASLQHLRLQSYSFASRHLRKLLTRHTHLRALDILAPTALIKELHTHEFGEAIGQHHILEELSLDCGFVYDYKHAVGYDLQAACDELAHRVLARVPNLKRLCLNRWSSISEDNVNTILRICPNLEELRLADVPVGGASPIVTHNNKSRYFRSLVGGHALHAAMHV